MENCRTSNGNLRIIRAAAPCAAAAAYVRGNPAALLLTADESAAAAARRALAAEDGILPPVLTLPQLAAAAEQFPPESLPAAARLVEPDFAAARRRLVMEIHALLHEQNAEFPIASAEPLAAFMEEFVAEYPALSVPPEALPQLCEKMEGYRPEAELLSALWMLLHGGPLLAARRALADFARRAPPLAYAGETPRLPWEDDFLRQCAGGAVVFEPQTAAPRNILDGAAGGGADFTPRECRSGTADSLDGAAKLALAAICGLASEGREVGIVVYDRLLARRLRAAAENARIYIEDDGGWRMETLSFGGALRQWADAAAHEFSAAAFGRLLSAPYWAEDSRRTAAECAWRKILAGGRALPEKWADFSRYSETDFAPFAEILRAARRAMPDNAPPAEWTRWLLAHSAKPLAAWKNDAVATRLRAALCLESDGGGALSAAEFYQWLEFFMRGETSGARDIKSRVRFVSPKTSRRFDGLLLLGADGENLPPPPNSFLGDKGREMLSLPSRRVHVERQFAQFSRLLAAHSRIAAVWRRTGEDGRETPPSPFWQLFAESARQNGADISDIAPPPEPPAAAGIAPPPPPAARARRIPETVGITAAKRLMQCPYHFFAADILRLREDDGDETIGAAALGTLLHRGMKQFAEAAGEERAPEKLLAHWREVFSALPAVRPGAKLALQHWLARGEMFIQKEAARRDEGWMPQLLEHEMAAVLMLDGRQIRLRGRLDRADQNGEQWAIVDYKSGGGPNLKEMRSGESPQLPLYAFLLGKETAQWRVCYPAKPDEDKCELAGESRRIAARLRAAAKKIAAGAVLPAHGAPKTCKTCPSRRLCRREHWAQTGGAAQ